LTHAELRDLFENEEAHRDWRTSLSAVAGIYLILAEKSGEQYVGSAQGANGIWGRWQQYAKSGDGGNVLLRKLIQSDSDYPERFRFSMLQVLPKNMTTAEVLDREALYKNKLGTRAKGLNLN
jgi:GIY-YIG catalytic domain-containing protein